MPNDNVIGLNTFRTAIQHVDDGRRIKLNDDQNGISVSGNPIKGSVVTFFRQIGSTIPGISDSRKSLLEKSGKQNAEVRDQFLSSLKNSAKDASVSKKLDQIVDLSPKKLTKGEVSSVIAQMQSWIRDVSVVRSYLNSIDPNLSTETRNKVVDEILLSSSSILLPAVRSTLKNVLSKDLAAAMAERQNHGISEQVANAIGILRSSGEVTKLGGGAVNTVYQGNFGDIKNGVFKPSVDAEKQTQPADAIGLPSKGQNLVGRSVAAAEVNQLIGSQLIGKTAFAEHDGKHGFVTEFANGEVPKREIKAKVTDESKIAQYTGFLKDPDGETYLPSNTKLIDGEFYEISSNFIQFDFQEPKLAAQLTELQLFDELIGQVDRHLGNLIIDIDPLSSGFKSLTAIDNDFAFGPNPNIIRDNGVKLPKSLPAIVPKSVSDKFVALQENDLRANLTGLLKKVEIDNTVARLKTIQLHLANLNANSGIINDKQWDRSLIKQRTTESNSYIGGFSADIQDQIKNKVLVFDPWGKQVSP